MIIAFNVSQFGNAFQLVHQTLTACYRARKTILFTLDSKTSAYYFILFFKIYLINKQRSRATVAQRISNTTFYVVL